MTIHELIAALGLNADDEIPIWDAEATGEPTKKITASNFAAAMVMLANLVTGVKGGAENNYRHGNVNLTPANIGALASNSVLIPSAAFSIPSAGNSVSYSMAGLTDNHILTHWNFSSSAENAPPADLSWTTANGSFTITNNGGTTSETIRPVFELPIYVSITMI